MACTTPWDPSPSLRPTLKFRKRVIPSGFEGGGVHGILLRLTFTVDNVFLLKIVFLINCKERRETRNNDDGKSGLPVKTWIVSNASVSKVFANPLTILNLRASVVETVDKEDTQFRFHVFFFFHINGIYFL